MSNFHPLEVVDRGSETQLQMVSRAMTRALLVNTQKNVSEGPYICFRGCLKSNRIMFKTKQYVTQIENYSVIVFYSSNNSTWKMHIFHKYKHFFVTRSWKLR